jgi:DNA-binding FadR family transcriptional regulator
MARYQEIHQIIRRRIFDGEYPLGSNLPSEAFFCDEFSASRFTVREAFRRLQTDGMVERKQGACAKVIETAPNKVFIQSVETTSDLLQFARDFGYQLLSTQEVAPR